MLEAMEHADVVAGSRVAKGAQVDRQQPLRRRLVGWPFIALTRVLMREPTKDVYCGFKLWRGTAAEAVFSRQRLTGWVFDAEVLALARRLGFRVTEVGVEWADRRGSKLSIRQVLIPAIRELLDARRNVRAQVHAARREASLEPAEPAPEGQLVPDSAEHRA
jgi:dolichyl-phosphate beta-glucosyltransferase